MNADGSEFSSSELPRKVHPLRPKPVVNPDYVEACRLIISSNANRQGSNLPQEFIGISVLRGNELCDSTEHDCL
jgi:murein tripeptide amidase MpaA